MLIIKCQKTLKQKKSCCQFLPVHLIPLFKKCDNASDCFHAPDTAGC